MRSLSSLAFSLALLLAAASLLAPRGAGSEPGAHRALAAREVLSRCVEALGGEPALRRAADSWFEAINIDHSSEITVKSRVRVYRKDRDRVRIETSVGSDRAVLGYDGHAGWFVRSGIVADAPPDLLDTLKRYHRRSVDRIVLEPERLGLQVKSRGVEVIGGRPAHALDLTYDDGERGVLWIDATSYLPRAAEAQPVGSFAQKTRTFFDDYRPACGLRVSYHNWTERDSARIAETILLYFEADGGVSEAIFERPRDLFAVREAR